MTDFRKSLRRVWRSAHLYIGFHRDPDGNARETSKIWRPRNSSATLQDDPRDREVFLLVKSAPGQEPRDVQIKVHPDRLVIRRDPGCGWDGIIVEDDFVSVQVNGVWVKIASDGKICQELAGMTTYVDADGSVFKQSDVCDALMSGDGLSLSRRTATSIASISDDGVLARSI